MDTGKILVIGASGQIGIELVATLRAKYGTHQVIASDIRNPQHGSSLFEGPWEMLNVLNEEQLQSTVKQHDIKTIFHLAAMLSALGEQHPDRAWDLNMNGLFNVLDLAKEGLINKIFWPSSIAVFGPSTPKTNTPQDALCEPTTVYGISKLAGERWCEYYHNKYGVDVRSIRYPGLIGYKSEPGGGTTDYAVEIFHKALTEKKYISYIGKDSRLPMMYMEDAIRATIELMEAPSSSITLRSSYNVSGLDFTPDELALEIRNHIPDFELSYSKDFRDTIASTWPDSIDDSLARKDWNWNSDFTLEKLVHIMIEALEKKKVESVTL